MFALRRDRWSIAIVVAAFLLRLGWAAEAGVFAIPEEGLGGGDERAYVELAHDLARNPAAFLLHDERSLSRAPGQVAYLAACGRPLTVVRALNVLWSSATVMLVMLLAGWAAGPVAARAAGLAVAVSPPLIAAASSLLTETPFTALMLGGLAALAWAVRLPSRGAPWAALGGSLFALASLFRPLAQALAPAIAVAATVGALCGLRAAAGLRRPAWIAAAVSLVVLLPVLVKNQLAFGRFAVANGLGAVAYLGAHPLTFGDDPEPLGMKVGMPECAFDPHSTPCDRILLRRAIEWIRADPAQYLLRIPVKVHRAWVGNQRDVFYPAKGWRATAGLNWRGVVWRIASVLEAALLGGLFLWTLWEGAWTRHAEALLATVTVAVLTAVAALTFAIPRFGEPLIPCFAIAAATVWTGSRRWWPGLVAGLGLALCTFLGP